MVFHQQDKTGVYDKKQRCGATGIKHGRGEWRPSKALCTKGNYFKLKIDIKIHDSISAIVCSRLRWSDERRLKKETGSLTLSPFNDWLNVHIKRSSPFWKLKFRVLAEPWINSIHLFSLITKTIDSKTLSVLTSSLVVPFFRFYFCGLLLAYKFLQLGKISPTVIKSDLSPSSPLFCPSLTCLFNNPSQFWIQYFYCFVDNFYSCSIIYL